MRNAAIIMIVVALGALGFILYSQVQNISDQPPAPRTRETDKKTLQSPTNSPSTSTSSTPVEAVAGSIEWKRSLALAKDAAKAGDKVIVVDVYTDWCGWCKRMDEAIYSHPRIVGLSRQEVFLKLDAEDGGEGQSFARRMNVKGYPTTIILDSDGERVTEKRGFISSPDQFIQFVEGARSKG